MKKPIENWGIGNWGQADSSVCYFRYLFFGVGGYCSIFGSGMWISEVSGLDGAGLNNFHSFLCSFFLSKLFSL